MTDYVEGTEFQVNTTTQNDQDDPAVAALSDGGYVVAWVGVDRSGEGIYAQRYNASGNPVGGEMLVNTATDYLQYLPAATGLADGGYLVTWTSEAPGMAGVYAQRYAADGTTAGGETQLSDGSNAAVTGLADGGYAVAWDGIDSSGQGVYVQKYAADGTPANAAALVNTTTYGPQARPSITALDDGGYVVTWQGVTQYNGSLYPDIFAQRYDAIGNAVGGEVRVSGPDPVEQLPGTPPTFLVSNDHDPVVAALADGGYVIVWDAEEYSYRSGINLGREENIFGQRYAADGTPQGGMTSLGSLSVTGANYYPFLSRPTVLGLSDGGYVAIWEAALTSSDLDGVQAVRIGADGAPAGVEAQVNTAPLPYYSQPNGAGLADGSYVIAWSFLDGSGAGVAAKAWSTALPANAAPVANADSFTTGTNTPLVITAPGLLANDTDADADALTAEIVSGPAHGALALNPDGSFTYTPDAGFSGLDGFAYKANDGTAASPATPVALTVTPPSNAAPVANADSFTTGTNTPLVITAPGLLANDTDADADALTAEIVSGPAHGALALNPDGSFTYTPDAGFSGLDGFAYKANDGTAASPATPVALTVTPPPNTAPVASADSFTTGANTPLVITAPGLLANDTDADADALTAEIVSGPAHGALALNPDGSFTYTPDAGFSGLDGFAYKANDGTAASPATPVALTVTPPPNTAPVASADSFTTGANTPLVITAPGLLANDTDADADALTAEIVSGPAHGALALNPDGSFTYTPDAGFSGADGFAYKANDGTAASPATPVALTITPPPNTAPVVLNIVEGTWWIDFLFGTAAGDDIRGGAGLDLLFGGGGDDRLAGGPGNDLLFGGGGSDTIAFLLGGGNDIAFDFEVGPGRSDKIALDAQAFASYDALVNSGALSGNWLGTEITYGDGSQLLLFGVNVHSLTADHFTFV